MKRLFHGDCLEILPGLGDHIDCIFADPPDNIGLKYDGYTDTLPPDVYVALLGEWVRNFVGRADTTWISFNAKWTIEMGIIVGRLLDTYEDLDFKPCVQTYTFGQHNSRDFGGNYRPLWRFRRERSMFCPDQIRIESERQRMGDKRADPRGRVPGDVFDFTRVVGNSKQRRKWHKTQLNEGLVERCILSCTEEGDHVLDPFGGTGTTLRVCGQINRKCTTMDISRNYCERIAKEHGLQILTA